MIGQRLGHYRIEARLGEGGMGVVYRAHDTELDRPVALKVLARASPDAAAERERLLAEARASSALNHPNICTIYGAGVEGGRGFIAMELVEGEPLSRQVPQAGLPIDLLLRYGVQIADGLVQAHERGIVHGDLKSSNLIVTRDGRVKILDFGLARKLEPSELDEWAGSRTTLTEAPAIAGTLPYMSPETLQGRGVDRRSDLWSLGVVLYEMATGSLPFTGRTPFDVTSSILQGPKPGIPPHVPAGLRAVILQCLEREPGHRYQRAVEVRAALRALESDAQVRPAVPGDLARARARRRVLWALPLLVAAMLGWWLLSRDRRETAGGPSPAGRLRLLMAPEEHVVDPDISPDGTMLAYVARTGERFDLFVRRAAGGGPVRLTDDEAIEGDPDFSPDGEWIAFSSRPPQSPTREIRVVPSLGGPSRRLADGARQPAWSPDGERLAAIRQRPGEHEELIVVGVDGSVDRVLVAGDGTYPFLGRPDWSPDGSAIAFARGRGGVSSEIWIVDVDGGPPRPLVEDPPGVFRRTPVFTADGRAIVHVSNAAGATNLWWLSLADNQADRLTLGPGPDFDPSVAADGTVAFLNVKSRNVLQVHDLAGGNTRTLVTDSEMIWAPVFSLDGSEVAYSRGAVDGSWSVWSVPAEGGATRQLTTGDLPQIYPRYTRDGDWIVYFTWSSEPDRVWRIPRAGGPAVALTPERDGDDGYPDVSPDGRWLAFVRSDAQGASIHVMPVSGGEPRRLIAGPSEVPRWSPDGTRIAFARDRGYVGGIFTVRADGSEERRLTDEGGWPVWWPDGSRIGYLVLGPDDQQAFRSVAAEGGVPQPVPSPRLAGTNHLFDVSPDGRRIVCTNSQRVSNEVWLLEPRSRP